MVVEAPDFWNIPEFIQKSLYGLAGIAILVFFAGFWLRARIWSLGIDTDNSLKGMGTLQLLIVSITKLFSSDCIFASRVFRWSILRGFLLVGIMWGFILLFLGTVTRGIHYYGLFHVLEGNVWLVFSLVLDCAGLALMLGTGYGIYRRYINPPERMITSIQDGAFLIWLMLIILTGFLMEGSRIIAMDAPAMDWSPVGYLFGLVAFWFSGSNVQTLQTVHVTIWTVHMLLSLSFIAYIPYSKGFHMLAAQISTSLAQERNARRPTQKVHWLKEDH